MSSSRGRKPDRQRIHLTEHAPENPAAELAEVEIYKTQSVTEDDFCVGLTARFGTILLACENWSYNVASSIREAYVQLETNNCLISREGRYGDDTRPSSYDIDREAKSSTTEKSNLSADAKGSAGVGSNGVRLPSLAASFSAGKSRSTQSIKSESHKIKESVNSITAASGGRWRFSDVISETLSGKYEPHEHLCKISVPTDKIRGKVIARMYFYPKDLSLQFHHSDLRFSEKIFKERPSNLSVAKALLAKYMRGINPNETKNIDGRIIVGLSRLDYKISND